MAELTATQIETLITLAYNALTTALTNPKPNYSVGGRSINYGDYIKMLNEQISGLQSMSAQIPSESAPVAIDNEITDTGSDNTSYEGDSDL